MTSFIKFFILALILVSSVSQATTIKEYDAKLAIAVQALNKNEHSKSLELLNGLKKIAQDNKWYKQEFLAINNIGANYYMMLDYGEALDNYLEAYKIALAHLDASSEMIVLNNIAILYSREKKYKKAEDYFTKAYDIAHKKKDSVKIALYSVNLALAYNESEKPEKALHYLKISRDYNTNKTLTSTIQIAYIDYLVLIKNYEFAKKEALQLLPKLNTVEALSNKIGLLLKLSKIYEEGQDYHEAIKYVKAAQQITTTIENKETVYERYFDLFIKTNKTADAALYKDSIVLARDSINVIKNGKLFENSRIKFELENSQQQLSKSNSRLKTERIIFAALIGLALFLILSFIWALRNSKLRQEQQKIAEDRQQKINLLELEKEINEKKILENELKDKETRRLLEQEKLKNELESKNRKLATKALYFSTRNSLIEDIVSALSKQIDHPDNTHLKSYINQLQQHLRQDNEYDNFFSHFEEINQHFLLSLKQRHPDLNANDIRFLSYIYMNLSNKEIASLLNITLEACRKRKERIAKKLNLQESADLYHYITST